MSDLNEAAEGVRAMSLTDQQEQILRHMLGADERYKKKQWGFRNRFCSSNGHQDQKTLEKLRDMGLVVSNKMQGDTQYFFATRAGAKAIGFKPYQMRNTDFPD